MKIRCTWVVCVLAGVALLMVAGCSGGPGNLLASREGAVHGQARAAVPAMFRSNGTVPLDQAEVVILDLESGNTLSVSITDESGFFHLFVTPGGPYKIIVRSGNIQVSIIVTKIEPGEELDAGIVDEYSTAWALLYEESFYHDEELDLDEIEQNHGQEVAALARQIAGIHQAGDDMDDETSVQDRVNELLTYIFTNMAPTPFANGVPPGPPAGIPGPWQSEGDGQNGD